MRNGTAYQRFKSEIEVLQQLKDVPGVVKILHHYFPDQFSKQDAPFYVMPLAARFSEFIKGRSHEELFHAFLKICHTVELLHSRDITHRDIKPSNFLVINGEPLIADFGLANFPMKKKVSDPDEAIGAKWTIAPEMQRISSVAEFKKADVYSLAKTLWILITEVEKGFEGQYIPRSAISLDKHVEVNINKGAVAGRWYYFSIVLLEQLIIDSTSNDPDQRPDIETFTKRLSYWLTTNLDYFQRNPYEWHDALKRIFPIGIPSHCEWEGVDDILAILIILTEYDNLNHCFLPIRGGIDMDQVALAEERDCLQIEDEIFKPAKLYFEYLSDPSWSYFRIDFAELKPHSTNTSVIREYLYLSKEGNYSSSAGADNIEVARYLKGSLVITAKTSPINDTHGLLDGYSGIHSKLSPVAYRKAWELLKEGKPYELFELLESHITR